MSAVIVDAIQNGTFPDSEEILLSDLKKDDVVSLLRGLQLSKDELNKTVCEISQNQAGDVDGWISQAKRVQQDIARCKEDYQYILDEHSRIEKLRDERLDATSKVTLLEDEISFNATLQEQIQLIARTSASLNEIDADINNARLLHAAKSSGPLATTIGRITSKQSRVLLLDNRDVLLERLKGQLDSSFDAHFHVEKVDDLINLSIAKNGGGSSENELSLDELIDALSISDGLADSVKGVVQRVETTILPHLHNRSKLHVAEANANGPSLDLKLTSACPDALTTTRVIRSLLTYIHDKSPSRIVRPLLQDICDRLVPLLIVSWLDPAVPPELEQLELSHGLQDNIKDLADWLAGIEIDQSRDLTAWVNQISRTWLSRRKADSLDVVRNALKKSTGTTKQAERVEKQIVSLEEQRGQTDDSSDDWARNWDDDAEGASETKKSATTDDDGSDAWGFDTDDQVAEEEEPVPVKTDEDEVDAWGWGDEEEGHDKPEVQPAKLSTKANGISGSLPKETEMVLSEKYTVTDIPDLILDGIAKDITDFHTLQASPQTYFKNSTTSPSGMQTLPTLALAMFRAIATDHYSTSPSLSRMNLYNDTLYMIQRLHESAVNPSASLSSDIETLSKFARQTYTSELTTQRTILHDLLDNSQGFISCTVEPYLSQCESAIASTTDYIRSLHAQWLPILSPSHLAQSIGSLLNNIMSKMVKDIEDMEDISEAQSQKLIQFMESVSKLEDLFRTPNQQNSNSDVPASTIALHVPSYLRFQYLQQILEGSLADIKYLWTDAGLGLEFSAEEVVDLIKALFAESSHRRSAIQVIRSGG